MNTAPISYYNYFFNKITTCTIEQKFFKKKTSTKMNFVKLKLKIVGNFFKLKYLKNKTVAKLNLCLAHKIYFLNNALKKNEHILKKIKKK